MTKPEPGARDANPVLAVALTGVGIALLSLVSIPGQPSLLSPLPLLVVLPMCIIGPLALLMPAVLFYAWVLRLFRGNAAIPYRSSTMLAILTVLTLVWFVDGWHQGVRDMGVRHTVSMACLNALLLGVAWYLHHRGLNAPSFGASLRFHAVLFAWLAWAAFPSLGSMALP